MLDLTFDPSFVRILTNHNDFNVLALPPDLQFGDLARLNAVNSDFYQFKASQLGLGRRGHDLDAQKLQRADQDALSQLTAAIHANSALRLWWTDVPNDVIGLWWLAALCAKQKLAIQQVHVPTVFPHPTQSALYKITKLGELDPDWLDALVQTATTLTVRDLTAFSYGWQNLHSATNEVRILLNGELLSVPETYFDPLILAQVKTPPRTFPEHVKAIGRLLGEYQISLPDWWWHYRLQQLFDGK